MGEIDGEVDGHGTPVSLRSNVTRPVLRQRIEHDRSGFDPAVCTGSRVGGGLARARVRGPERDETQ